MKAQRKKKLRTMLRDERPRQPKLKYNVSSHMWPNISGDEMIGSSYEIKTTRKKTQQQQNKHKYKNKWK